MIPPMQIQNIDPVRLQLLQRVPKAHMQTPLVVPAMVGSISSPDFPILVVRGKLRCEDDLVAILACSHPFADPGL